MVLPDIARLATTLHGLLKHGVVVDLDEDDEAEDTMSNCKHDDE